MLALSAALLAAAPAGAAPSQIQATPASGLTAAKGSSTGTVTLANFTEQNALDAAGLTAAIDWGDGSSSAGDVSQSGAGYAVLGEHVYPKEGQFTVTITITDALNDKAVVSTTMDVAGVPSPTRHINARFSGRFTFFRRRTQIRMLVAHHVPRGATLVVRCDGSGCFQDQVVVIAKRGRVKLTGLFRGLVLAPGAHITIEIDKPGFAGADYQLKIRRHRRPKVRMASG
ncbi:MAG: PKD domain-containing protein [Solirubrobacteraceae bacterium]